MLLGDDGLGLAVAEGAAAAAALLPGEAEVTPCGDAALAVSAVCASSGRS